MIKTVVLTDLLGENAYIWYKILVIMLENKQIFLQSQELVDQMSQGVLLLSLKENIVFMNKAAHKILGLDIELLNSMFVNKNKQNLEAFLKLLQNIKDEKYDQELELLKNSIRNFRKEIKIDAQYFNVYLSRLDKDTYLIELAPIIYQDMNQTTHELKRPLQNIKTLVETLILGAKNDPEKLDDYLAKLNHEADRLADLVTDMLSLSHLINSSVDLNIQKHNLFQVANKVLDNAAARSLKRNIELVNEVDKKFVLNADLKLLEHLLANFVDNAIKYNIENGKVFVRATQNSFSIVDTGLGISPEDQEKIFEQFYRIKDRAHIQGSGLGLSIVKQIIDLHHWQVEIISKEQVGTEFKIVF